MSFPPRRHITGCETIRTDRGGLATVKPWRRAAAVSPQDGKSSSGRDGGSSATRFLNGLTPPIVGRSNPVRYWLRQSFVIFAARPGQKK